MDRKTTKKVLKTAAAINGQKRRLTRKENKELKRIDVAFKKICGEFTDFLFWLDWDDTTHVDFGDGKEIPVDKLNPFKDFNNKWIAWCEKWRKDSHHNTPVNDMAFHDWAMNNTKSNIYDEPLYFSHFKFSTLYGCI